MKAGEQIIRLTPPKGAVDVVVMVWWLGTKASGLDEKDRDERYDERDLEPAPPSCFDANKCCPGCINRKKEEILMDDNCGNAEAKK